ncbi:MAG: helix-turn-helix transcriptional regulator [Pseudomonadota bacterium]
MITDSTPEEQRRFPQLETLLLWEGRLNNARLRELFGLSSPRASVWIRELREARPDWLSWEPRSRSFVATPAAYAAGSATASLERYIGIVGLSGGLEPFTSSNALQAGFPALVTPPPEVFGPVNRATHAGVPIEILYMSLQHPEPHVRVIHPHSLVRTDQRWHVRAFCEKNRDFRDFNLSRIRQVRLRELERATPAAQDVAWHTLVQVRFVAHPELPDPQAKVIRMEYFSGAGSRVETCRAALVHYFVKSVQAAVEPTRQVPPDYVLAVFNAEELKSWLFPG